MLERWGDREGLDLGRIEKVAGFQACIEIRVCGEEIEGWWGRVLGDRRRKRDSGIKRYG